MLVEMQPIAGRVAAMVTGGAVAYLCWMVLRVPYAGRGAVSRAFLRCAVGGGAMVAAAAVLQVAHAWPHDAAPASWGASLAAAVTAGALVGLLSPIARRIGPLP